MKKLISIIMIICIAISISACNKDSNVDPVDEPTTQDSTSTQTTEPTSPSEGADELPQNNAEWEIREVPMPSWAKKPITISEMRVEGNETIDMADTNLRSANEITHAIMNKGALKPFGSANYSRGEEIFFENGVERAMYTDIYSASCENESLSIVVYSTATQSCATPTRIKIDYFGEPNKDAQAKLATVLTQILDDAELVEYVLFGKDSDEAHTSSAMQLKSDKCMSESSNPNDLTDYGFSREFSESCKGVTITIVASYSGNENRHISSPNFESIYESEVSQHMAQFFDPREFGDLNPFDEEFASKVIAELGFDTKLSKLSISRRIMSDCTNYKIRFNFISDKNKDGVEDFEGTIAISYNIQSDGSLTEGRIQYEVIDKEDFDNAVADETMKKRCVNFLQSFAQKMLRIGEFVYDADQSTNNKKIEVAESYITMLGKEIKTNVTVTIDNQFEQKQCIIRSSTSFLWFSYID